MKDNSIRSLEWEKERENRVLAKKRQILEIQEKLERSIVFLDKLEQSLRKEEKKKNPFLRSQEKEPFIEEN